MQLLEMKQKLEEIIKELLGNKLKKVFDLASYLRDGEEAEKFLKMQQESTTYKEWISAENDIYDEVFKDEIK